MFRTDMMMREVRRIADALARVVFLRKNGRVDEALAVLESPGLVEAGPSARALSDVPHDELEALLRMGGVLHVESAARLVELLVQAAELYTEQHRPDEADDAVDKALRLLVACFEEPVETFPLQLVDLVEPLVRASESPGLDADTVRRLLPVYEAIGRYDRAEDMLFLLAEAGVPGVEALGLAFYERVQRVTPTRLRKGNLPLKEVAEGRAAFLSVVRRAEIGPRQTGHGT